jgi:1,5-anhydro-D-fructose reductase (1,5-anhydro-D-mannitol-forming)
MKLYNWGILGCGDVTEIKSGPAFQQTENFNIKAVMRRDAAKAEDYAKRHNIEKYFSNAEELIQDVEIDAIYIATPPDTHLYYALKVAEAGKICCIEKPMAPSYQECVLIVEAFSSINIPLYVAYYRRSLPRFNQVKKWIDQGAIGALRSLHWDLSKPSSGMDRKQEFNWRTDAQIAYGGYFDDLASHGIDLFTYLCGDILDAKGMNSNQQKLYTAKDSVLGLWQHSTGVMGTGNWNFGTSVREDKVVLKGSEGTIRFSVFEDNPICLENAEGIKEIFMENPIHIQQYHVENMRLHLLEGIPHPSTGKTAMHASWVLDKILCKL